MWERVTSCKFLLARLTDFDPFDVSKSLLLKPANRFHRTGVGAGDMSQVPRGAVHALVLLLFLF